MGEWSFQPHEISQIKKGRILRGSWGYDQTNNEFCKVEKNTGKTLICQKLGKIKGTYGRSGQEVGPDVKSKECKPFRIKIDRYKIEDQENISLHGKMPFGGDCSDGIKVHWGKYEGGTLIDTER